ncbi:MAG: hypothetical protein QOE70_2355, partial [Chthoniobacter sp.]|nr:hypothetical protein [Chthoniobacter sp.]
MKVIVILLLACLVFGTAGYFTYDLFVKPQVELKREKEAPATPPPPDPTLPELEKCLELRDKGQLVEARKALEDFIERFAESSKIEEAKNEL